jgi:hypothetical protein
MDPEVNELEVELKTHVVQCEERWKTTFNRLEGIEALLQRIETRMMAVSGASILFLAGLVITAFLGE